MVPRGALADRLLRGLASPIALHASWDQIGALDAPADGNAVLDVR